MKRESLCAVVNQANTYYRLAEDFARSLSKYESQYMSQTIIQTNKLKLKRTSDKIIRFSSYLKVFFQHASKLMMITSKIETKDSFSSIREFWKVDPLFNISFPLKATQQQLKPSYRLSQQYEQVETYLLLLFEIMHKLYKYAIQLTQEQEKAVAECFKQELNIKYEDQWCRSINWSNKITHLRLSYDIEGMNLGQIMSGIREWKYQKSICTLQQLQKSNIKADFFLIDNYLYQILLKIQNQRLQVAAYYQDMFLNRDQIFTSPDRKGKFHQLLIYIYIYSSARCWQVKQSVKHNYSNRYEIYGQTASGLEKKYKEQLAYQLEESQIAKENNNIIVNHSPKAVFSLHAISL